MISNSSGLSNKDANLWLSPMTPKGTRRSTGSRLYDISRHPAKARRLRTNTNDLLLPPSSYPKDCPSRILLLRISNHKNNMSTTDRPKGSNRLLLSRTHEISSSRSYTRHPMESKRGPHTNDRPRTSIFSSI